MFRLFNPDSPVMQFLSRLADLVILNLLWILFSLPVVTLGASTTALYRAILTLWDDGGSSTVGLFWSAFRKEFKKSTLLFLILLPVLALMCLNAWLLVSGVLQIPTLLRGLCMLPVLLFCLAVNYVYPLTAQFENSVKMTLKNAVLMSLANLPASILLLAVNLVPALLFFFATWFFFRTLIFWFVIGVSLIASCGVLILRRVFKKYIPSEEDGASESSSL